MLRPWWRPTSSADTVFFKRLYVLMFVHLGSRRVLSAACTSEPNATWVTQQARNLSWQLEEEGSSSHG
jgi:putative transposase